MKRCRLHVWYSGHVQGVGFRYAVRVAAQGFEGAGLVRNLLDGRVELVAEGERDELEAFRQGILDSGLGGLIRNEAVAWEPAQGNLRGFVIANE
jgi:acylphosphatase